MTKYLFLLGFSLFSISFLSTSGYTAEVYQGVMYETQSDRAVSCNTKSGVVRRLRAASDCEGE